MLEDRPGEDDPVQEGDREARRDPARELAERPARSRAVDVDLVADAGVERRDHERLAVGDEAEVGDEPGVEHRVDRLAVVPAPLGEPAHARASGRGGAWPGAHVASLRTGAARSL